MDSGILIKTFQKNFYETGNLISYYSFSNPSGKVLFNNLYTTGEHFIGGDSSKLDLELYPAISVGSTNNATAGTYGGSGYFNYSDLLQIGTGLPLDEWSVFLNFLQSTPPSGRTASVLLSSMDNPGSQSGFNIGLNASNRVYVDFINGSGARETHTHSAELSNFNNLVSVSKDSDQIQITYHDFIENDNKLETFDVSGMKTASAWKIGGMVTPYGSYTGFSGYIDDILISSEAYNGARANLISDSFFTTGVESGHSKEVVTYSNKVTGTTLNTCGVTGTGITGYVDVLVDTVNGVPLYQKSGVTGELTGLVVDYLTGGLISGTGISLVEGYNLFDYSYSNKFADNSIVFDKKVSSSSTYELYSYNQRTDLLNKELIYNFADDNFITETGHSGENINVYMDGRAMYSGTGFSFNDFEVDFTEQIISSGTGLYNFITGSQVATPFTGSAGTISLADSKYFNKDVYLDGIKLVSGSTWSGTASAVKIDASSLNSGTYFFLPRHSHSVNRATGSASQFIKFDFKLVNEQLWLDGLKQKEGVDYFKTSNNSLLNSNNYLTGFTDIIFNNETGFFNV